METDMDLFESTLETVINMTMKKVEALNRGKRKSNQPISDASRNLIINYLPPEMNEDDMRTLFETIGEVDKVHIMRDMSNRSVERGKSLGYGFVDYVNPADGEHAVEILNGTKIQNKVIKVAYSRPNTEDTKETNIYISGLSHLFTQDDLHKLYSTYGKIVSSRIVVNDDKKMFNIAFVRFNTNDEALKAISATNNTKPNGCTQNIQVRLSNTPNSKNVDKRRKVGEFGDLIGGDSKEYTIYVYNLNPDTDDNALWKLFGAFGAIKNAKAVIDPIAKKCKGFGFVSMTNLEEAVQAIETLNGYTHDNRVLQVSFKSNNKDGELNSSIKGLNLAEVTGTYTLYVYNINPDTEDTALWKLFGQFGAVKNVKVIRDEINQKAKGFGFVTMKNINNANDAVKYLNGFTLDNRVLQVSFKTDKNSESRGSFSEEEIINSDIPSHIATDRTGAIQIFVYNLSPATEERSLWKLFGQFGAIKNVKVIEDKNPKFEYKGHAFISMKDYKEAALAVGSLNGTVLDGRTLQVSFKLKSN